MSRSLIRGMLTLALVATATVLGGAGAQAATPRLAVSALSFAQSTVDATQIYTTVNRLTFTVTNTDPDAETVEGVATLRARSTVTGELVGHERTVHYGIDRDWYDASFVSGTPQESTYEYAFVVPRYSDAPTTSWEVTKVTIVAGERETTVSAAKLQAFPGYRFTAATIVDSSGPTVDMRNPPTTSASFLYVSDQAVSYNYQFTIDERGASFWKGTLKVAGPGGQSVTTPFQWERNLDSRGVVMCGDNEIGGGQTVTYARCSIRVTLPAGANAGNWRMSQLVVFNDAGVRTTYQNPTAPSVTVTSNSTVRAVDFAVSPNPVDNWREDVSVELSLAVTGAQRGVASLNVWFEEGCQQWGGPIAKPEGRIALQVRVARGTAECALTGLTVVDGIANAAVYGPRFGAPDPQIQIRRIPAAEPPTALSATLAPATLPLSELFNGPVVLTVDAVINTAPVVNLETFVYDAEGNVVYEGCCSGEQAADGTVTTDLWLGWNGLGVGEYTIGFTLTDAIDATSSYGVLGDPASQPVPGGPLVFTVTDG
ncbi:hypothetical protein O7635_13895 [Asanoa sp. WMMD1127]|uniref:hypothetical protein n=1 Tax=Asanoa sp. WMMD1127 TaxID=3016107 RepID=UPI002416641B|nr:hypothetical protein [Asanoa sp. WMMD1127]MDG4822941.1 hypothetical protein [Asanoa sp. WMMD1127]